MKKHEVSIVSYALLVLARPDDLLSEIALNYLPSIREGAMPDAAESRKILELANDTRKFEISLFWQRSLFFWGFTTTAIAGYAAAYQAHNPNLQFSIACIGLICGVIWTLVNRSSAYWQRVWERKVEAIQLDAIGYDLFSYASNDAQKVQQTWGWGPKHYSLSKLAIAFSDFTILIWSGTVLASSPLWPIFRALPGLNDDRVPVAIAFASTVAYVAIILIFARPNRPPFK